MGRRKRVRANERSFSTYVYKVLKQVHPDKSISRKAMPIMNSFVHDMANRIQRVRRARPTLPPSPLTLMMSLSALCSLSLSHQEAAALAEMTGGVSLTSREIQTAVRLILPRELAKARPFAHFVPLLYRSCVS
jgi:histone H2B